MKVTNLVKKSVRDLICRPSVMNRGVDPEGIEISRKPLFIVGTGRCGTHFFSKVMEKDPSIYSIHTDDVDPFADSFLRYARWYGIDIDLEPTRVHRLRLLAYANSQGKTYLEANAYLSSMIDKLYEWYEARIVLLVRSPLAVANSHYIKDWYSDIGEHANTSMIPGYQPGFRPNYVFGRIMPRGEEFNRWEKLTRIGKIGWWINVLNLDVLKRAEQLPKEVFRVQKIEEFDYEAYSQVHSMLGGTQPMSYKEFEKLRKNPPGKGKGKRKINSWSSQEYKEFVEETREIHSALGYEMPRKL